MSLKSGVHHDQEIMSMHTYACETIYHIPYILSIKDLLHFL